MEVSSAGAHPGMIFAAMRKRPSKALLRVRTKEREVAKQAVEAKPLRLEENQERQAR